MTAASLGGQVTVVSGTHPNAVADNVVGAFTLQGGNTGSWFNVSTGRYTPPAGKYFIQCQGSVQAPAGGNGSTQMKMRKNGSVLTNGPMGSGSASFFIPLTLGTYVDHLTALDVFRLRRQLRGGINGTSGQLFNYGIQSGITGSE